MWNNPKTIEAAIKRLTREIDEIDNFFYKANETDDRLLYAGMLERKRDDMVRSAVLQMHTAIEDLLNSHIVFQITGATRRRPASQSQSTRALRKMLFGGGSLGFDMKLTLALALRLINTKTKDRLVLLNTLRNKCSHNWVLKVPVRHGKRPAQKKPPLLLYEGRDLHSVAALKDFVSEYSGIYLKLYLNCP
jgi:uncharacterized protein with von Willebrand factor type A (vWA) domain